MKKLIMALALLPTLAVAHDYMLGDLDIQNPWTRATPPAAKVAAGYVTVTNKSLQADRLVAATMDGTGHVMLHQSMEKDGMAHMMMLKEGIVIPAGQTVTLQPGGLHIMAMDLSGAYVAGTSVSGSLTFEHAGTVPVSFKVEPMAAMAPAGKNPMEHGHH